MYITINDINSEKTIYLYRPITNPHGTKEVAIMEAFSDNVTYEITAPLKVIIGKDRIVHQLEKKGKYTSRELNASLAGEGDVTSTPLIKDPRVIKTNKLIDITELHFNLNELDNTLNLKNGRYSNNLLTYHISEYGDVTYIEPKNPQYKKLKNGFLQSLTLKITDQNGDLVKDSLGTTVVLYIRETEEPEI